MGRDAIFECKKCEQTFRAREGGGLNYLECRCVKCDAIKEVQVNKRTDPSFAMPSQADLGTCAKCGGELRSDILPMCPNCKSREVRVDRLIRYYGGME